MKRMYTEQEVQAIVENVILSTVPSLVMEMLSGMGISYNSEDDVLEIANLKITETLRDVMNSTGIEGQALVADSNNQPKWTTLE